MVTFNMNSVNHSEVRRIDIGGVGVYIIILENYSILREYTLFPPHITCRVHAGPTCRPHMLCEEMKYTPGVLE